MAGEWTSHVVSFPYTGRLTSTQQAELIEVSRKIHFALIQLQRGLRAVILTEDAEVRFFLEHFLNKDGFNLSYFALRACVPPSENGYNYMMDPVYVGAATGVYCIRPLYLEQEGVVLYYWRVSHNGRG